MMSEIILMLVGAVLGIPTGLYFERRNTKVALALNEDLKAQLSILRQAVYSLGGDPDVPARELANLNLNVPAAVKTRALATQDASGRIRRSELVSYFAARGVEIPEIEAAIATLITSGEARGEDQWLHLK
jgi:hypothetical protein